MRCPICTNEVAHVEEHHLVPREYGGQDLETVNICSTCHHGLHHQANALYASTKKPNKRVETRLYFDEHSWERAAPYVAIILEARQNYELAGRPEVRPRRLIVSIPADLHAKLHRLKRHRGYTSLDRFVRDLLTEQVDAAL